MHRVDPHSKKITHRDLSKGDKHDMHDHDMATKRIVAKDHNYQVHS